MSELFNLDRFVEAQDPVYSRALAEIREGAKRSHWMWYIFPQIAGLGRSTTAQYYSIACLEEARAFLRHPVLGPRLRECVEALRNLKSTSAGDVFGEVDAQKLKSSLTLFVCAGGGADFERALSYWFGAPDQQTIAILQEGKGG